MLIFTNKLARNINVRDYTGRNLLMVKNDTGKNIQKKILPIKAVILKIKMFTRCNIDTETLIIFLFVIVD